MKHLPLLAIAAWFPVAAADAVVPGAVPAEPEAAALRQGPALQGRWPGRRLQEREATHAGYA